MVRVLCVVLLVAAAMLGGPARSADFEAAARRQPGASTTTLTLAPATAGPGQPVAMTATVSGKKPTGIVTFMSGTRSLGTAALGGRGKVPAATLTTADMPPGVHAVTAHYGGDADDAASASAPVTLTITRYASTTSLDVAPNPSTYGQAITLTATVGGAATPAGSVTFTDGAAILGTASIGSGGRAALGLSALPAGSHSISAVYGGDAMHDGSTSPAVALSVGKGASSTSLSVIPTEPALGQTVTLAASISGSSVSGIVTFHDGGFVLGTAPVMSGAASFSTSTLAEGLHLLGASYGGDAGNASSSSPIVPVTVGEAAHTKWSYEYDAMGRLTRMIDPNLLTTSVDYDRLGRPILTRQADGTIIGLGYDTASNLARVVDPRLLTTTYTVSGLGDVKDQSSPDTGATRYTYDSRGLVHTRTDARGKTTTYGHDSLGRLTSIAYPAGTGTTFEYDGGATPAPGAIGELTRINDESGQTLYSYDSWGRLVNKTVSIGAKTFSVSYGWGDSGPALDKLTSITYPGGSRVNYAYDPAGDVSAITVNTVHASGSGVNGTPLTLLTGAGYNVDGNPTGWNWTDGSARTIGYDRKGWVTSYTLGNPAGAGSAAGVLRSLARDNAGRIKAYTHSGNGAMQGARDQAFAYDALGRLTGALIGGTSTSYAYDATGNRTSKTIGGTAYANTVAPDSNRLTQTQDGTGTAIVVHDAAGNITSDAANTYTYSDRGRMASANTPVGTIGLKYNGLEQRVSKTGAGTTHYVYDEGGQLLGEYDQDGKPTYETIYLGMMPVGVMKQAGSAANGSVATTLYNVHADQIATPRVITRQDHVIVWRWDSAEAFGASAPDQNPSGLGVFAFNQRFPGQVFDEETGLAQNWHREYDAWTGRYRQFDPLGLSAGVNGFGYVDGNPISIIDPTGELGIVGALAGGGIELATQLALNGGNLSCVDWWAVGVSGAVGALGGAGLGGAFKLSKGSMKWENVRRRYRRTHDVSPSQDVHHWAIQRNGTTGKYMERVFGRDVKDNVVNHPANLIPLDKTLHQGVHNSFGPLGRWWYGTPAWAKAAEGAIVTGVAGELTKDCTCR